MKSWRGEATVNLFLLTGIQGMTERRRMMKGRLRPSYLLILCLVFIMAVGISLAAGEAAEKTEEWVERYNGPGDGPDFANAITVDSLGNVLVTGRCQVSGIDSDYATIKYDPNGTKLWDVTYDGLGNNVDFANAITVDSLGNVYVTGESYSGESSDYATIKYNPNGTLLWDVTYDGPWGGWDTASAIVIDSLGNVYVTGRSEYDYATIKYDLNGTQLWEARYDGPGSGGDSANAIAIDSTGYIYVTGISENDYATIKYNPNDGSEIWVKRYNGPGNSTDEATDIAIDSFDNICVTGKSTYSGTNRDYATIKYNPNNGSEIWTKRYNGPGNSIDDASAIAIDSSDNVYVTGESIGNGTNRDYATIKYNPNNGSEIWTKRYNGPGNSADKATDIAIDSSDNVYVTGESAGNGTNRDYATIKYNPNDGTEIWWARYNSLGNDSDEASAIAIDSLSNVYVTGDSIGSGTNRDYATLKYGVIEENKVIMEIPAGWSMISIPVKPDNAALNNLFPDAVVVYKYQKTKGYARVKKYENLEDGIGYWILLKTPESYTIWGTAVTEYTIQVADGWYMIGGCRSSAQKMINNGTYVVVYGFDQENGYIQINDEETLEPENGYWILFSDTSAGAEFTASTSF